MVTQSNSIVASSKVCDVFLFHNSHTWPPQIIYGPGREGGFSLNANQNLHVNPNMEPWEIFPCWQNC